MTHFELLKTSIHHSNIEEEAMSTFRVYLFIGMTLQVMASMFTSRALCINGRAAWIKVSNGVPDSVRLCAHDLNARRTQKRWHFPANFFYSSFLSLCLLFPFFSVSLSESVCERRAGGSSQHTFWSCTCQICAPADAWLFLHTLYTRSSGDITAWFGQLYRHVSKYEQVFSFCFLKRGRQSMCPALKIRNLIETNMKTRVHLLCVLMALLCRPTHTFINVRDSASENTLCDIDKLVLSHSITHTPYLQHGFSQHNQ